jgi:hypothetical protein
MIEVVYDQITLWPMPIGLTDNKGISIKECPSSEADAALKVHHYSKTVTANRFASFSVNDGLGYMQLGYGIKPGQKHTISSLIEKGNYAEFDRMWLSDELPKFSESRVIGLLLRYLKRTRPELAFLITYADGSVGNVGTIYQATNAIYLGSVQVDFYILEDGTRVHPVSMWHKHKTRAREFLAKEYPGIRHIKDERQHRYLYVLDKKIKREFLKTFENKFDYPKRVKLPQLSTVGAAQEIGGN